MALRRYPVACRPRNRGLHGGSRACIPGLLINLDTEGMRIIDLADCAGISKQAMGRLVDDLEQLQYIARSLDVTDRRATMIVFTEQGRQFLNDAVRIQQEIEDDYAAVIGQDHLTLLRTWLVTLVQHEENSAEQG